MKATACGSAWEPAAGGGAIVQALRNAGRSVVASDIFGYDMLPDLAVYDYLTAPLPSGIDGIITNPPYRQALRFLVKALAMWRSWSAPTS